MILHTYLSYPVSDIPPPLNCHIRHLPSPPFIRRNRIMSRYELSGSLFGHDQDIKSIAFPEPNTVFSASRDGTVRSWEKKADQWHGAINFQDSNYINSIIYVNGSENFVAFGGQSTCVSLISPTDHLSEPDFVFMGHDKNVCSLHSFGDTIISGSWDATARVWSNGKLKHVLRGHTHAVWAVLAVSEDEFFTASADTYIKHWKKDQCIGTFKGHSQSVRGLALFPEVGIVSCSNDETIRIWDFEGNELQILTGHTNFVYSVAVTPSKEIISSGEDRTVRVWRGSECVQVIALPCISVWTVAVCKNGDIAAGGSDSVIRIFTRDSSRRAGPAEIGEFNELVSNSSISQETSNVDKSKLPGPEALKKRGNKEGQVIMVNQPSGLVEAHQWMGGAWIKIGDVVSAPGSDKKTEYDGKMWDYVFDVDIEDGKPPLKLPFNVNENPYDAAQRFINKNELPQSYLEEIVHFIVQNTEGVTLGQNAANPYADVRQQEEQVSEPPSTLGGTFNILPQHDYLALKSGKADPILKGLTKFNTEETEKLSDADLSAISPLLNGILNGSLGINEQKQLYAFVQHIIGKWTPKHKLVGLDILRLLVSQLSEAPANFLTLFAIGSVFDGTSLNNFYMSNRVLVNLFQTQWGLELITKTSTVEFVFAILEDVLAILDINKNAGNAVATLLLNYSVYANKNGNKGIANHIITILKEWGFKIAKSSPEASYRLAVALGTTLFGIDIVKDGTSLNEFIIRIDSGEKEQRLVEVLIEVKKLL